MAFTWHFLKSGGRSLVANGNGWMRRARLVASEKRGPRRRLQIPDRNWSQAAVFEKSWN